MTATVTAADSGRGRTMVFLCVMMFLQFGVYGIWFPIAKVFLKADPESAGGLGFTEGQIGWVVVFAAAIGAIISPFVVQVADRYFRAERFLAVLLVVGGTVKFVTASQTTFTAWLVLSIAYTICYMPTIAICNAIAMRHLDDPTTQFPRVRIWGTIGWIAMGYLFSMIWLKMNVTPRLLPPFFEGDDVPYAAARMLDAVRAGGVLSIAYGIFAWLFLPATPPRAAAGEKKLVLAEAFGLLRHRSFAVLLVMTLVVSMVHWLYFLQVGDFLKERGLDPAYLMPAMSIGQFFEIVALAILGFFLKRWGVRMVMTVGILAYVVRFMVFGTYGLPLPVVVTSIFLHGICFAFFYGTAFIYVDRIAPKEVRNSAQAVFVLVMYGLGPILTVLANRSLAARFAGANNQFEGAEFSPLWYALGVIALVAAVVFFLLFRDETGHGKTGGEEEDGAGEQGDEFE